MRKESSVLRSAFLLLFVAATLLSSAVAQNPPANPEEADTAANDTAAADSLARDTLQEQIDPAEALVQGAEPEDMPPFKDSVLATPYHSIIQHLYYLQDSTYKPELAAQTFNAPNLPLNERIKLATRLKRILDGHGIYIYPENLPRNAFHKDSSGFYRYELSPEFSDIYLEKVGDRWLYSKKTVSAIPQLYNEINPFGIDNLIEALPKWTHNKFLGLRLWQYFLILLLSLVAVVVHKILTPILRRILSKFIDQFARKKWSIEKQHVLPVVRPISIYLTLLIFRVFVPALQLPVKFNEYLVVGFKIAVPLFGVIIFYRIIDLLAEIFTKMAEKTEGTMDDQLIPLVKKILKVLIVLVGTLFILDNLNFDITGIIAGLSIGGLAIALAAQDTLKNFFGSVMIFVDRPFQIGDWIQFDSKEGIVEEVGLRSTRVRTFADSLVYVPNGALADMVVDNYGLRVYRRYYTVLGLQYDTPPHLMEAFIEGLREFVRSHPKTRKDAFEIHFTEFAGSSLNIMVFIFFDVPSWTEELRAKADFNYGALKLAAELGVSFAFPTQTLHIENLPGQPSLSIEYDKDAAAAGSTLKDFLQKQQNAWEEDWKAWDNNQDANRQYGGSGDGGG